MEQEGHSHYQFLILDSSQPHSRELKRIHYNHSQYLMVKIQSSLQKINEAACGRHDTQTHNQNKLWGAFEPG